MSDGSHLSVCIHPSVIHHFFSLPVSFIIWSERERAREGRHMQSGGGGELNVNVNDGKFSPNYLKCCSSSSVPSADLSVRTLRTFVFVVVEVENLILDSVCVSVSL